MIQAEVSIIGIKGIPEIKSGALLHDIIVRAIKRQNITLSNGDLLVVAQKIVSKSEGRFVDLKSVKPSKKANQLQKEIGKDARLIEIILRESKEVLRFKDNLLITINRLGIIHANSGVDQSNVCKENEDIVLLLPIDPDKSARILKRELDGAFNSNIGVIINDTAGRPWRMGIVGYAIGIAGLAPIEDLRGKTDMFGRKLLATQVAIADEIASAASLVQGQADEKMPVVLIRGLNYNSTRGSSRELIRDENEDMFR